MSKRARSAADQEMFEGFAALLRQSASRAMERLRIQRASGGRNVNSGGADGRAADGIGLPLGRGPSSASPPPASFTAPSVKPIDTLVIQFVMYYLNLQTVPANHYVRLSQEVITASPERVLQPRAFTKANLSQLCEGLVAENTAAVVEDTLKDIDEFVDMREIFGEWLAERVGGDFDEDDDADREEEMMRERYEGYGSGQWDERDTDDGVGGARFVSSVDLAGLLYESLLFWLRVREFLHALSRGSANAYAHRLKPRYERELMTVLHELASSANRGEPSGGGGGGVQEVATAATATASPIDPEGVSAAAKRESAVKPEPEEDEDGGGLQGDRPLDTAAMVAAATAAAAAADSDGDESEGGDDMDYGRTANMKERGKSEGGDHHTAAAAEADDPVIQKRRQHKRDVATVVLADAMALANCRKEGTAAPDGSADVGTGGGVVVVSAALREKAKGIDPKYYAMVHARLGVMVSRDRLRQFSASATATAPPPLTVAQRNILEREEANKRAAAAHRGGGMFGNELMAPAAAMGVPLDYVPDDLYFQRVLAQQHDSVGEDEEIYKEEVVDYYLKRQQQQQQHQQQQEAAASGRGGNRGGRSQQQQQQAMQQPLVKPHRYCKVKTGYSWTQYNRTHYDSRTNPPPRTILWYEFTLFYPALVNSKKDMRNIFRIEDTPKGPSDDYCLLVFSVGPPYEDVAYRIVRKQWDTRRGGVRISFDATGKYKLFFRFSNSNYRR